jgi:peptidoglycan-associated lipoprotein
VPSTRLLVTSWGKEKPIAVGSDESAWAQNRREVTVVVK